MPCGGVSIVTSSGWGVSGKIRNPESGSVMDFPEMYGKSFGISGGGIRKKLIKVKRDLAKIAPSLICRVFAGEGSYGGKVLPEKQKKSAEILRIKQKYS